MNHILKAYKTKNQRKILKIKFGMKIPCDHNEAMMFDADNRNTNWKYAQLLELKKPYNFYPLHSLGPVKIARIPPGHTNIQVHLIYDYKEYGRYKSSILASGNMTGTNIETYYSIFISLCSMRTIDLLEKLNNIETRTGDISNTYMTKRTTDKIVFNSGPDVSPFGHVGNLILIKTVLYGLNSSDARFHSRLSNALKSLGFVPSMVGYNIWMRNEGD